MHADTVLLISHIFLTYLDIIHIKQLNYEFYFSYLYIYFVIVKCDKAETMTLFAKNTNIIIFHRQQE